MVTYYLFKFLCAWFALVLPSFRTFQALQHRPISEQDVERWAKYWTVVAAVVTIEYTIEALISWFPFYWEFKSLFILFLALPQTQGSTYIYDNFLAPFFTRNETDIDAHIEFAQAHVISFLQSRFSYLWNLIGQLASKQSADAAAPGGDGSAATSERPPTSPIHAAAQAAYGLWNSYGAPYASKVMSPSRQPEAPVSQASASGSSTSFQSRAAPPPFTLPRNSFVPEAQIPLPVTPEHIYRNQQTIDRPSPNSRGSAPPPSFPVPEFY